MSVAFRRETDEEHLEPRFELPIPAGPNPVTARGLALIEARVAELDASVQGEEDAERRKVLLRDLRYWHTRRTTAEVVAPADGEEVAFGVRVRFRMNGAERTLDIVGHDEADTSRGQVAFNAPLARALRGGVAGDTLPFAGRDDAIEVLAVGAIPHDC